MKKLNIRREFWLKRIADLWHKVPIVWLSGARRSGKTTLVKFFTDSEYINCDLPSDIVRLSDPETFYSSCAKEIVIFDEIHNLEDPSRVLKIGADEFTKLKILATGSSTQNSIRSPGEDPIAGALHWAE